MGDEAGCVVDFLRVSEFEQAIIIMKNYHKTEGGPVCLNACSRSPKVKMSKSNKQDRYPELGECLGIGELFVVSGICVRATSKNPRSVES